ncbi:MAG: glycosyltransferase family 4 protein [Acidimicrobiales bacterium]
MTSGVARADGRIRVGANLLWLVPGVVGGSEEYTVRMLESLARLPQDRVALTLFVNRALLDAHPDLVAAFPTVVAPLAGSSRGVRVAAEATWLARQARSERLDLVHHLGGTMPILRGTPGLVTIHDLQPFAFPDHFNLIKRAYLRATVPTSVRHAVAVVVLTEWTRTDVVDRLGIDPERILLVPPSIDPPMPVDPEVVRQVRLRYGIADAPFFLYPAITYAHKNHLGLVRAFAGVAEVDERSVLVLTGGEADAETALQSEIGRLGLGDRVRRTGRIPRRDLDALFSEARALTFPSRYEGFGIPTLEAMSRGVPVIASTSGALPEVVGDGGVLIDPDDVEAWTHAMLQVLLDQEHRDAMVARGSARAAGFTWNASAEALVRAWDTARTWIEAPPTRAPSGSSAGTAT